jgi:hypothetical protein
MHSRKFDEIYIHSGFPITISFVKDTGNAFTMSNTWMNSSCTFNESSISHITFLKSILPSISWAQSKVKVLTLSDLTLDTVFSFEALILPDSLTLNNINITEKGSIELTNFILEGSSNTCNLFIDKFDYSKLKINYQYFKLEFPKDKSNNETFSDGKKENIYTELLGLQKKDGYVLGYEKLDKEYKSFLYLRDYGSFVNWLNKWWWDYGYSNMRIVKASLKILGICYLLNLAFYRWLRKIYKIESFDIKYERYIQDRKGNIFFKSLSYCYFIFLYTNGLFWGLKFDLNRIDIKHRCFVLPWIIFFQHIVGLICLGWLTSIVIFR